MAEIKTNLVEKAAEGSVNDSVKYGFLQISESFDETKAKLDSLASAYQYKGSVATAADLPEKGDREGDVYNAQDTGMNYAWTGTAWDTLGAPIHLQAGNGISITDDTTVAVSDAFANSKQDKLTAGDGISIVDGVISVSYPLISEV